MSDHDAPTRVSAQLDEIRARVEAATPGPWEWEHDAAEHQWSVRDGDGWTVANESDFTFIAHAREDIPFLLSELSAALTERDALKGEVEGLRDEVQEWMRGTEIARAKSSALTAKVEAAKASCEETREMAGSDPYAWNMDHPAFLEGRAYEAADVLALLSPDEQKGGDE